MAQEFEYDASGATSYYFLLSILALYLLPATISRALALCSSKRDSDARQQKKKLFSTSNVIYTVCLVVFLLMAYRASTFEKEILYDPFEVLELSQGATDRQIKKKYRELSLLHHPDRNANDPEAEEKFVRIAKAYQALTDPETRKNWEEYGNPDGPVSRSYGIALPSWLVQRENKAVILLFYGILFMVVLPVSVWLYWRRSSQFIKGAVLEETVRRFAGAVSKNMNMKGLIDVLSIAKELQEKMTVHDRDVTELETLIKRIPELPNNPFTKGGFRFSAPWAVKGCTLYHTHLNRLPLSRALQQDVETCLKVVPTLIQALVELCSVRVGLRGTLLPMELSQHIMQALPFDAYHYPLLQVPHFTVDLVARCTKLRIKTVADLFALSEAELRDKVFKVDLSEDQIQEVLAYGAKFPYIYLELGVTSLHPDAVNDASKRSSREITATFPAFDVLAISYTLKRETLEQHRERVATSKKPSEASSKAAEASGKGGKKKGKNKFKPNKAAAAAPNGSAATPTPNGEASSPAADKEDEAFAAASAAEQQNGDAAAANQEEHDDHAESDNDEEKKEPKDVDDAWDLETTKDTRFAALDENNGVPLMSKYYTLPKNEAWWCMLGDAVTDTVQLNANRSAFCIEKIVHMTDEKEGTFYIQMTDSSKELRFYAVSDSYLGVKVEIPLTLKKGPPRPPKPVAVEEVVEDEDEEEAAEETCAADDDDDY